jgi:hypothetical protein
MFIVTLYPQSDTIQTLRIKCVSLSGLSACIFMLIINTKLYRRHYQVTPRKYTPEKCQEISYRRGNHGSVWVYFRRHLVNVPRTKLLRQRN